MMSRITDKPFIEIEHHQVAKDGQNACGDAFICRKFADEGRAVCILADGLGSGIKANVLAKMTATMAMKFFAEDMDIKRAAEIIMNTLPVCSRRHIAYATFTIMDIQADGQATIIEYDNPPCIVIRQGRAVETDKQTVEAKTPGLGKRQIKAYHLQLMAADRVILTSDGVTQSGIGTALMPLGWSNLSAQQYAEQICKNEPDISARKLARLIAEKAIDNDGHKAKDDITCAVIYLRLGRRLMVASGPPLDTSKDRELAEKVSQFNGKKVVCGGTTAKILSRELGRKIKTDISTAGKDIPPASTMKGLDLITEGTLTLNRTAEILEHQNSIDTPGCDAAKQLARLLIDSDIIEFLVGTRINEAHQDPNLPVELDIRRNLVKRLAHLLENNYLKKVEMSFI